MICTSFGVSRSLGVSLYYVLKGRDSAAMLVVSNTFLEWRWPCDGCAAVRSQSAPAEIMVDRTFAEARPRERGAQRRKKTKRRDQRRKETARIDEQVLDEFASLARQELWALITKRALQAQGLQEKWADITKNLLGRAAMSKMRVSMTGAVYRQLACWTCGADVHMLWRMGVFRRGGKDTVELWSTDMALEHPVMQILLREAKNYVEISAAGAFQLAMLGKPGKLCKCNSTFSVQSLRAVAVLSFGVDPGVKLIHLGVELTGGSLVDYGVGPGSVVFLLRK